MLIRYSDKRAMAVVQPQKHFAVVDVEQSLGGFARVDVGRGNGL